MPGTSAWVGRDGGSVEKSAPLARAAAPPSPRMMVDTRPQTSLLRELARVLRRGPEDLGREHLALVDAGAGPLVDAMDALLADAARVPLSVIAEAQRRAEGQRY